jgi:hypothetical protein
MEAVKDAYLEYVATMFDTYRVFKTPPALMGRGVHLKDCSEELRLQGLLEDWETCMHDELICIVGRRGSLGPELGRWLEAPRNMVLDRLEKLLLMGTPQRWEHLPGQSVFYRELHSIDGPTFGLLVGLDGSQPDLLASRMPEWSSCLLERLPRGSRVFAFGHRELVVLVSACTDPMGRALTSVAVDALGRFIADCDPAIRVRAAGASWPLDASSPVSFCRVLQQGWIDAVGLAEMEPGPTRRVYVVYASDRVKFRGGGDGNHDGGVGARVGGPDGPLSAGAARRLEDEDSWARRHNSH